MINRLFQYCLNRRREFTQSPNLSERLVAVQGFEPRTLRI
jgi:hypothetical protein